MALDDEVAGGVGDYEDRAAAARLLLEEYQVPMGDPVIGPSDELESAMDGWWLRRGADLRRAKGLPR